MRRFSIRFSPTHLSYHREWRGASTGQKSTVTPNAHRTSHNIRRRWREFGSLVNLRVPIEGCGRYLQKPNRPGSLGYSAAFGFGTG
jgi:hypothetical protein